MIVQLTGTLIDVTPSHAVMDVGGIGYELGISANTAAALPAAGEPGVTLLTRFVVRENAMQLFGFSSGEERALFDRLCAISGVGPSVALSLLSTFTPQSLAGAVIADDAAMLATAPGVGKKLAARLLVELQGVFANDADLRSVIASAPATGASAASSIEADVTAALLSMGFTPAEAALAIEGMDDETASDAGRAVAWALRRLGGGS